MPGGSFSALSTRTYANSNTCWPRPTVTTRATTGTTPRSGGFSCRTARSLSSTGSGPTSICPRCWRSRLRARNASGTTSWASSGARRWRFSRRGRCCEARSARRTRPSRTSA
ncbi:hypothetical protein AFNJKBDN_CDS0062 [Halorubrum virus V_ICIS4]|nr:hypothetical protein AFNJKBDN_CDS0062 [Halorubrum virus V_ICIS4]